MGISPSSPFTNTNDGLIVAQVGLAKAAIKLWILAIIMVDRILRPRTLRPSKDFIHKTNKYNGILDLDE
jgi:hypothetical protein